METAVTVINWLLEFISKLLVYISGITNYQQHLTSDILVWS